MGGMVEGWEGAGGERMGEWGVRMEEGTKQLHSSFSSSKKLEKVYFQF